MSNVLMLKELMLVKPFVRNVLPGKKFQDRWAVDRAHRVQLVGSVRRPARIAPTVTLANTTTPTTHGALVALLENGAMSNN